MPTIHRVEYTCLSAFILCSDVPEPDFILTFEAQFAKVMCTKFPSKVNIMNPSHSSDYRKQNTYAEDESVLLYAEHSR